MSTYEIVAAQLSEKQHEVSKAKMELVQLMQKHLACADPEERQNLEFIMEIEQFGVESRKKDIQRLKKLLHSPKRHLDRAATQHIVPPAAQQATAAASSAG